MKKITLNDLRLMNNSEGLILQGCGGDLQEWVDGINELLTEEGILQDGNKFQSEDAACFEHNGHTDILFPFANVKLNLGKLAMWRLRTREQFAGVWLSDFVPNNLGGFLESQPCQENRKPDCPLIGENGNIYNLIGLASQTLHRHGMEDHAKEMQERITGGTCHSYDQALCILGEYVNITSANDFVWNEGEMNFE